MHPIEEESYRILRSRVDLSQLPPLSRAVAERVVHASADVSYADDLVLDEEALEAGWRALMDGAPVIADVRMVAAGITGRRVVCALEAGGDGDLAAARGDTRSRRGMRDALRSHPGAVVVVGCAPTALAAVLEAGAPPRFVVGLPVGFVGAAETKAALRSSGIASVSNVSEKGGSAVAAAAFNALLRFDDV